MNALFMMEGFLRKFVVFRLCVIMLCSVSVLSLLFRCVLKRLWKMMSQQLPFAFAGERVLPQKNAVAECILYLWGNKRGSANPSADVAQVGRTLVVYCIL